MWIADLKIVLSFCICTALAYHGSKQDYIKWREGFLPKRPTTTEKPVVNSANDIYYESLKLRHHSRFPNLDRVMLKIDNMKSGRAENDVHPVHNKVRHQNIYRTTTTTTTTTDEGLFGDDYGDLEYEDDNANDDVNEYDDWEDENGDNFDEYEDETADNDDPFSDDDNEWQAEEATEPPVSAPVSSLTKYKWDNYGTRSRVEESRRQQLHLKPNEGRATNAVIEHYMKVRQEGQCRKPQPKVVSVQSEHPDPSKTYTPHCTILHRCAEDTGCCPNFDTKCGPKTQDPVHLYFYTKTLGVSETKVERLTFYNHTECTCLEKSKRSTPVTSTTENNLTHGLSLKLASYPENIRHCKCPEEFTPKFRYDSRCSCDCEEYNQDCIRMKKGKEFFSLTDRRCIIESQCGIPVCEYGVYMRHMGRCQRKQEKLDTFSKMTVK